MGPSTSLVSLNAKVFTDFLNQQKIHRFFFIYDRARGGIKASDPRLQSIADFLQTDARDYNEHEGLFFQVAKDRKTLFGAFIHRTIRGQGLGGLRYWDYDTFEDFMRDGLRLSNGMTFKNALAGLWIGGGKGVIWHHPDVNRDDVDKRATLFKEYGDFVTSLQGCYITAEDVGTTTTDTANVFSRCRYTVCIPVELGGRGNPSPMTARGVLCGMEASLSFAKMGTLEGKTIAVQGLGNVSLPLVQYLFEKKVAKVVACDIFPETIEKAKKEFSGKNLELKLVEKHDTWIYSQACDIFAPCATGGILNPDTIPLLKSKIVCGATNNQLKDPVRDGRLLMDRGIVYVPDFLCNRMGVVYCAYEDFGYASPDPLIEKHLSQDWEFSIHQTTLKVLNRSKTSRIPPAQIAIQMADELSHEENPIIGHRGQAIIDTLVREQWQNA